MPDAALRKENDALLKQVDSLITATQEYRAERDAAHKAAHRANQKLDSISQFVYPLCGHGSIKAILEEK